MNSSMNYTKHDLGGCSGGWWPDRPVSQDQAGPSYGPAWLKCVSGSELVVERHAKVPGRTVDRAVGHAADVLLVEQVVDVKANGCFLVDLVGGEGVGQEVGVLLAVADLADLRLPAAAQAQAQCRQGRDAGVGAEVDGVARHPFVDVLAVRTGQVPVGVAQGDARVLAQAAGGLHLEAARLHVL